ncbi:MAG TPA: hypothetical protein PLD55_15875 [bacterium]|nr:hypothetical protein [bacterium]
MNFYQKKVLAVTILLLLFYGNVFADKETDKKGGVLDSYVEFPVIVFVGQITNLTPYSIIFENRYATTKATNDKINKLMEGYASSIDPMSHGFAKALKVVTVVDNRMRASFYLDNITSVFADDMQSYMKFLPLYYMFKHNIDMLKLPKGHVEKLKKLSLNYYMTLPMAEKIMNNSWFVGVFRIDPDSSKLIYQSSNYYSDIDELLTDDFAKEYMVDRIVKAGMVMSVTKVKIRGKESEWIDEKLKNRKEKKLDDKNKFYNKTPDTSGESN